MKAPALLLSALMLVSSFSGILVKHYCNGNLVGFVLPISHEKCRGDMPMEKNSCMDIAVGFSPIDPKELVSSKIEIARIGFNDPVKESPFQLKPWYDQLPKFIRQTSFAPPSNTTHIYLQVEAFLI